MKSIQKGFTLIELMIVVAIIAILAAIAISQYQDYVIRSQVSEGSSLADGIKTAVAEFVNNHGYFPAANSSAGVATNTSILGQYVSKVDIGTLKGTVQAYYGGGKANSAIPATMILIFSAITHAGSIEWHCKSTTLKQKWCSSSCSCTG
jgi:type IV pilus assembly protein PilA